MTSSTFPADFPGTFLFLLTWRLAWDRIGACRSLDRRHRRLGFGQQLERRLGARPGRCRPASSTAALHPSGTAELRRGESAIRPSPPPGTITQTDGSLTVSKALPPWETTASPAFTTWAACSPPRQHRHQQRRRVAHVSADSTIGFYGRQLQPDSVNAGGILTHPIRQHLSIGTTDIEGRHTDGRRRKHHRNRAVGLLR